MSHTRGGELIHSDAAVAVEHLECFHDNALAVGGYQLIDRTDTERLELDRAKLSDALNPVISRKTGEVSPAFVPFSGELTRVQVTLQQGRHHQIRRLCRRAGLRLCHLRRIADGPIVLGSAAPGEVRELSREEKRSLFEVCLPRRLGIGGPVLGDRY